MRFRGIRSLDPWAPHYEKSTQLQIVQAYVSLSSTDRSSLARATGARGTAERLERSAWASSNTERHICFCGTNTSLSARAYKSAGLFWQPWQPWHEEAGVQSRAWCMCSVQQGVLQCLVGLLCAWQYLHLLFVVFC